MQDESRPPPKTPQQPPVKPPKGPVQVRRDYNPKMAQTAGAQPSGQEQFLISPITGEKIPAEKMQKHMQYGTYIHMCAWLVSVALYVGEVCCYGDDGCDNCMVRVAWSFFCVTAMSY